MKILLQGLLIIFLTCTLQAQHHARLEIRFNTLFDHRQLKLNDMMYLITGNVIRIETLKFYISHFELLKDQNVVWAETNSVHLLDASDEKTMLLKLFVPDGVQYDALRFNTGIDSATNVSGNMDGDLDPLRGMYWTWQSGYINLKLEASCNNCDWKNHELQWHTGGYRYAFNTLQQVMLKVQPDSAITVETDLADLFNILPVDIPSHIMSPGPDANSISKAWAQTFHIRQP